MFFNKGGDGMGHCVVPEAEEILDKEFPVLNKGFVRLVDYLGSDERIVQAARVSYGEGTKAYRADKGLINYLLRHNHTSPFEQVNFTFHVKMPIFVARQWIRHRTARVNEISGRYSYLPRREDICFQSVSNKQGRSDVPVPDELKDQVLELLAEDQEREYASYQELLNKEIARELARINLPLSLYTEWYWQMDLHNLFHFLKLRMDFHAQREIRDYAVVIFDIAKKVCPIACEAFSEHLEGSVQFSRSEMEALRGLLNGTDVLLKGKPLERFMKKIETGREE
jgi:thymidylate synthase (FAD)